MKGAGQESAAHGFRSTRWSLVERARGSDDAQARAALEDLCRAYSYPLYAYLRRAGHASHAAEDLLQSFFAALIEKRADWGVERERGRFRAWLLGALRHAAQDQRERERALKRGGAARALPLDALASESRYAREAQAEDPERLFERLWSLETVAAALARLERAEIAAGRAQAFEELRALLARPSAPGEYAQLALRLRKSETSLKVAVHRLRERYREALREEVRDTLADGREERVDEELAALLRSL